MLALPAREDITGLRWATFAFLYNMPINIHEIMFVSYVYVILLLP